MTILGTYTRSSRTYRHRNHRGCLIVERFLSSWRQAPSGTWWTSRFSLIRMMMCRIILGSKSAIWRAWPGLDSVVRQYAGVVKPMYPPVHRTGKALTRMWSEAWPIRCDWLGHNQDENLGRGAWGEAKNREKGNLSQSNNNSWNYGMSQ